MRYWLYKNNSIDGGPAGYRGDWLKEVFTKKGPVRWGGHYSTESYEVAKHRMLRSETSSPPTRLT